MGSKIYRDCVKVGIGQMVDPGCFWVCRTDTRAHKDIVELEEAMAKTFEPRPCGKGTESGPKMLAEGMLVAVLSSRTFRLWQRGRIERIDTYGGFSTFDGEVKADVFLIDVGRTLKDVCVGSRIRELPEIYAKPQKEAFLIKLEGLVPVHQTLNFNQFSSDEKFRLAVSKNYTEFCHGFVHALTKRYEGAYFKDSGKETGVVVKGGYEVKVGRLYFNFPLNLRIGTRLKPYTNYLTNGMSLDLENSIRIVDLNESLVIGKFAVKVGEMDLPRPPDVIHPVLSILDVNSAEPDGYLELDSEACSGKISSGAEGESQQENEQDLKQRFNLLVNYLPDDQSDLVICDDEIFYDCQESFDSI